MSALTRETGETRVRVELGAGTTMATGDDFLDHMLVTLARYAGLDLEVRATGDMRHHLVEDVAITLGALLGRETPATCVRYGDATIPMDDALVHVALDAGGRPHYEGDLPSDLYDHFFRSLALNADWTLHVRTIRGRDRHHVVEAAFKALGMAIRQAMADDGAVFSTKGNVAMAWDDGADAEDFDGEGGAARATPSPDPASTASGGERAPGEEGASDAG